MALGTICVPTHAVAQAVYTVNTTNDTIVPNACSSGAAGCSLRGAITAANAAGNVNIVFAIPASDPSCNTDGCVISLTSFLPVISGNISITGSGNDRLIVRSATDLFLGVIEVNSAGSVTLSGLTIADGGSASVSSRFGGILKNGSGTLNVIGCHVRNNRTISFGGAGIVNLGGVMNVINSTIYDNMAILTGGGGIANDPGATLNVVNSTIYNNVASNGGGGILNRGTANITNSTIIGNSAPGASGKLPGRGGGIFNVQSATLNIKNTIVALNSASNEGPDVFGTFVSAGFNLVGKRDGSTGFSAATDLTGTIAAPLTPGLDPAGLQNNGGPTLTIKLLRGSPAIDKATSSGLTGILTTDQRGAGFRRTRDNLLIPNAIGGDGTDIGAFENPTPAKFDFDGDGNTDVSIFRSSNGQWWHQQSSDGQVRAGVFGTSTDRITPGDFTGDGKTDVAFWRPATGEWFILRSEDSSFFAFPFGLNGDVPAPADYDGDGKTDAAVFRPSSAIWYVLKSSGGVTIINFGLSTDKPVAADYDGDMKDDIAIFRPSDGTWWYVGSLDGQIRVFQFGVATDRPVPGDFTGDGKADISFYRPSSGEWFVLRSEDNSFFAFPWGQNGAQPVPGDYDGDGKNDPAIFQPSNAGWFVNRSASGVLIQQFGLSTDTPVPSAFIP